MIEPVKVNDIIKHFSAEGFDAVKKYEVVDALWGMELRKITDKDIEALKNGEYLYCNDCEYAQIICYEKTESEEESDG